MRLTGSPRCSVTPNPGNSEVALDQKLIASPVERSSSARFEDLDLVTKPAEPCRARQTS
jgi:hypothetical protein